MVKVMLRADIAGKLASLATEAGPRRLVVPAVLAGGGLRDFLRREQRGYHETERAAAADKRQALLQAFEAAGRAGVPEFDDRTDEPIETPSPELVPLRRAIIEMDQSIAAHDAALRALDRSDWSAATNAVLEQYAIVDATPADAEGLVVEFDTQGYAALTDPEARQIWRKILRGEPFDDDEKEGEADADDP